MFKTLFYFFKFNVLWFSFVCVYMCVYTCMWVPSGVRRGCQIPLDSHMLGTEPVSPERAVSAPKH